MTNSSGRDSKWWEGGGHANVSRDLWGAIIAGLYCEDRSVRLEVVDAVIAAGSPAWDEDLDIPNVLEERLRGFRPGVVGEVIPLPWLQTEPRIPPTLLEDSPDDGTT